MNTNKISLWRLLSYNGSIAKSFYTTSKTLSKTLCEAKKISLNGILLLCFLLGAVTKINAQVSFSSTNNLMAGWYQDPASALNYAPLPTTNSYSTVGNNFSNAAGFLSLQANSGSTYVNMINVAPDLATARTAGKFIGAVITPSQIIRVSQIALGFVPNGGGNYTFNAIIFDPTDNSETLIYAGASSTVAAPGTAPIVNMTTFKTLVPGVNYQFRMYPTAAGGGTKTFDNVALYIQQGTCPTGVAAPNLTGANYHSSTNAVIIPNGSSTANLSGITASNPNTNYPVISWHSGTPATLANRITNITSVTSGTYYAAFATSEGACYSGTRTVCIGNDSDGDGIPNPCDVDDDNDGILDTDECVGTTNVALASAGAVATQSSTLSPYTADKAIDGNTAGTGAGNNIAHTNGATTTDYWQVDLGSNKTINTINIFNRDDNSQDRLTNVYVLISDTPFPTNATDLAGALSNADFIYQIGTVTATNADQTITVPNIVGRYVRVQKSGNNIVSNGPNFLNFAEVQVFSCADTDGDGIANVFDLDSDNDGCLDAIEGSANVQLSQLVTAGGSVTSGTGSTAPNQNLCAGSTCIDTNGLPTIMATLGAPNGQLVGSSANAAVKDPYCTPPVANNDNLTSPAGMPATVPNIIGNDTDPSGSLFTDEVSLIAPSGATGIITDAQGDVTGFTVPGEGTWSYNSTTGGLTFSPQNGFTGNPTPINYTVQSTSGPVSNVATVTITYFDPCIVSATNPDSDGDGISNYCDLDDDNDGILDTDECNGGLIDFGSIATGSTATQLEPGDPSVTFTQFEGGAPLNRNVTMTSPIGYGGIVDYFIGSESNNIIRFQDSNGAIINSGFTSTLTFSKPSTPSIDANNTIGASNINQSDQISITAPAGVTWKVMSSANASITISNNVLTITGSSTSGTFGTGPYAEFSIKATAPLTSLGLEYKNIVNIGAGSFNSSRFSVGLCGDTDADGIEDYLDLDSDNDGCLDAIEGGANITASQLVSSAGTVSVGTGSTASNQNLCASNTCVNSNGVPQLSPLPTGYSNTTGQTVGSSANSSIRSGCEPDLSIVKTVNNTTPNVGSQIEFTLVVTNNGPLTANGIVVNDLLPSGYTFQSVVAPGGTSYTSATGVWTIGSLASGASSTLIIKALANSTGNYLNSATVSSSETDPVPNNNTSTATTTPVIQNECMGSTATKLNLSGGVLISGTANTVGAKYKYSNVIAGTGVTQQADIVFELTALDYGSPLLQSNYDFVFDAPQSTAGIENNFQPSFVRSTSGLVNNIPTGTYHQSSTWKATVYKAGTTTPYNVPTIIQVIDNDGSTSATIDVFESVEFLSPLPPQIITSTPTTQVKTGNIVKSNGTPQAGIGVDPQYSAYGNYGYSNEFSFKLDNEIVIKGSPSINSNLANRYASVNFGCDFSGTNNFTKQIIRGTVYTDTDGGTPSGLPYINGNVYANLVDPNGNIVASQVASTVNGSYSFSNVIAGTYKVLLTNTAQTVGSVAPVVSSLPPNYDNVTSTDATPTDGITTIVVTNVDLDGINFGINLSVCYESPTDLTTSVPVKHGITVLGRAGADNGNWPMLRNSAYTALEGKTKGFVVTRNASPETTITNPVVGMMVFDTDEGATGCLKIYTGSGASEGWKCFSTQTCP